MGKKRKAGRGVPVPVDPPPPPHHPTPAPKSLHPQWSLSQVLPTAGQDPPDYTAYLTYVPPITSEQWERCRYGQCEHHTPRSKLWSYLLRHQSPQAFLAQTTGLKQQVQDLEDECQGLWLEVERLRKLCKDDETAEGVEPTDEKEKVMALEVKGEVACVGRWPDGEGEATALSPSKPLAPPEPSLHSSVRIPNSQPTALEAYPAPPPQDPKDLYLVTLRYEERHGNVRTQEVKGVFSSPELANKAATEVFEVEFPLPKRYQVEDVDSSGDPWERGGVGVGLPQRRYGENGEVRYVVAMQEGFGFVAVLREELDVEPQMVRLTLDDTLEGDDVRAEDDSGTEVIMAGVEDGEGAGDEAEIELENADEVKAEEELEAEVDADGDLDATLDPALEAEEDYDGSVILYP